MNHIGKTNQTAGYTLIEVMVVLTIIGILTAVCAMTFPRAVEQTRADLAAANLRSIWAAQRYYRLENGVYADSIATLRNAGLIDSSILGADDDAATIARYQPSYLYSTDSPDPSTFQAAAVRYSSRASEGANTLTIDGTSVVTGQIQLSNSPAVTPSSLFTRMSP